MSNLKQKIDQLKWLQLIGIEYYCLETNLGAKKFNLVQNIQMKNIDYTAKEPQKNIVADNVSPISHNFIELKTPMQIARDLADKVNNLEELKQIVFNFDGCDLKKFANNTVLCDGNPKAKIMLIGEAPGASEDAAGIPFCGESGKLLDNILSCINVSRKTNAYITNTVFWRPVANRQPTQEEIDICRPFVEKHIALINPKLIILVGSVAATCLLGKHSGISKVRQGNYSYSNKYLLEPIHTTAIFHPAYLLRQPMQKKTVWYDLLKIQQFIAENIE